VTCEEEEEVEKEEKEAESSCFLLEIG